jgi:hypothetical protein
MSRVFQSLDSVLNPVLPTDQAAHYLMRRPQTLRIWATGRGNPPIQPIRVGGRLGWPTAEVKKLCGVMK